MASRKDRERRRRAQQQRQQKPPAVPEKIEPETPTWERRLEERAVRERWPMPPEMRVKILARLMDIIDWKGNGPVDEPPSYRDLNAAAKTIMMADRLNIEEQKAAQETGYAQADAPLDPAIAARLLAAAKADGGGANAGPGSPDRYHEP